MQIPKPTYWVNVYAFNGRTAPGAYHLSRTDAVLTANRRKTARPAIRVKVVPKEAPHGQVQPR